MSSGKGTGKPCGASYINRNKVCRVSLPTAVNNAINAAAGEVGAATLKEAVKGYAGNAGVKRLQEIRQEVRGEHGGNIVRGPKADELKRRLQEEGLLPNAKGKSVPLLQWAPAPEKANKPQVIDPKDLLPPTVKDRAPSVPSDIKKQLAALAVQDPQATPPTKSATTGNTKWAREEAEDFDKDFKIYKRIRGDADMIDWAETIRGAKKIGDGSFGTVLRKGDTVVKRGEIGEDEAELIKRVGEAGLGPRLLVAEVNNNAREDYGVRIRGGRLAMTVVPGAPMDRVKPDTQFAGKNAADVYWKAMADLHRLGIAHNDAHIHNLLIDNEGKGRWVDMGLAQGSPKAALAEALGAIANIPNGVPRRGLVGPGAAGDGSTPGNWQTIRWEATGIEARNKAYEDDKIPEFIKKYPVLGRIHENKNILGARLLEQGFTKNDLAAMVGHGIRSDMGSYNQGVWSKLTDKQAQDLINTLYEGI